jgi:uncharacterized protein YecE (DUF72 family)
VPIDFQFSVRAHRSLTHRYWLQPVQQAFEVFEKMRQICSVLKAEILHLQIPAHSRPVNALADNLDDFLQSVDVKGLRLALEIRGVHPSELPANLLKIMQDYNLIHCVDLSKGKMPAFESDIMYTRLFGKGRHNIYQPTDAELAEIDKRASSGKSRKIVMSFHFVRMYKDAARLKIFKQSGTFPKVTKSKGLSSLQEVLSEDARFPATKDELIKSQGWKIFDQTEEKRARAEEFLQHLPQGTYNDTTEVIDKLMSTVRR